MEKQSVVFLGSKSIGYHCLYYLVQQMEQLNIEIRGVLTKENTALSGDHSLTKLAEEFNIPVYKSLSEMPGADIIYSVQYHQILKKEDIQKAGKIAINLHMAPLPEYRGCNQFSYAIIENKTEFGVTIHKIDTEIDHGDILFERRFPIPPNCWIYDLYHITFEQALDLFIETIQHVIDADYTCIPQDELIAEKGSSLHYRHEIESLKRIELDWDAEKIKRHIRATYMPGYEPPYFLIGNEKIYFRKEWR